MSNEYFNNGFDDNFNDDSSASGPEVNRYAIDTYTHSENQSNGAIPPERPKRKKGGLLRRCVALVLSGLLFGSVAGTTMVGVNYMAQKNGVIETSKGETGKSPSVENPSNNVSSVSTVSNNEGQPLDVSGVADAVMPSVVSITNTQIYNNFSDFYGFPFNYGGSQDGRQQEGREVEAGRGSGIIIGKNDDELLIVTNNHVIQGADSLTVNFVDDSSAQAYLKGSDTNADLAVVAVPLTDLTEETLNAVKIASLGNSDNVKVGQGVIAIGNALGYGQSVTVGYISALNRDVNVNGVTHTLLQTDAAINPGNSGGALVNMQGEVIGINSVKYTDVDVEGIGYAIPISAANDIINDLMNRSTKKEVAQDKQGYIGIQNPLTVDEETSKNYDMPKGVFVYAVVSGSPAEQAGIKEKDIITKFDGEALYSKDDLTNILKYYEGGTTVNLTVASLIDGQYVEREVSITLGFAKDANKN